MGGSKSPSKTTQTQRIDPFLRGEITQNLSTIRNLPGFEAYPGTGIAPLTPELQQQLGVMQGLGQQGQDLIGTGVTGLGNVAGTTADQVSAGQANLVPFQNPFEQQVVDQTLQDIDRSRQMAVNRTQDQAIAQGAFGGSRSALLEAETNRNFADRAAAAAGQLRQAGFNTALGAAQNQQQLALQAALANQGAGLDAARLRLLGSQGALDAGQGLFGIGQGAAQYLQDRAQAGEDFNYQEFLRRIEDPRIRAQMETAAVQGIPFFGSSSTTQPGGSRLGSGIGGGLSGAALGSQIGGPWGAAVGGGLGLLGGMFG